MSLLEMWNSLAGLGLSGFKFITMKTTHKNYTTHIFTENNVSVERKLPLSYKMHSNRQKCCKTEKNNFILRMGS